MSDSEQAFLFEDSPASSLETPRGDDCEPVAVEPSADRAPWRIGCAMGDLLADVLAEPSADRVALVPSAHGPQYLALVRVVVVLVIVD